MLGSVRRAGVARGGRKDVLQSGAAAGEELRDQLAGQHERAAIRQGDEELAVDHFDLGAPEIEGEAEHHIAGQIDLDPLARRRLGNDERQGLVREGGDLDGGVHEPHAERVAGGLRGRMSALQRF
jgi:hypothetical protein